MRNAVYAVLVGLALLLTACPNIGAPSTFTLSLNPTSLTVQQGQSGGTTLTLTPQNGFTGTVTLALERQDGTAAPSGITLSPTSVTMSGNSSVTQTLTLSVASSLATGTYSLRVKATSGNLTRTVDLTLTVTAPPPDFTLSLNPTSLAVVQGGSSQVTLTLTPQNSFAATVSLSLVNPPGGVSLSPTSVSVPGSGPVQQTLTISTTGSTPTGTHALTIKAAFGSLERTATLSFTVNPPPSFDLFLDPTSLTVQQGQSGQTTLTLTPQNGFASTVNLTLENQDGTPAPSGITLTPTSVSVTSSAPVTQTLTLSVASSVATGTYNLRVKGTSGSLVKTANLSLTVTAPPDFAISLNPTSLTVHQGQSGQTTLTLTPQNGFTGPVTLSLEDQNGNTPSGITLSPTLVTVSGSNPANQPLTLGVDAGVPTGTYNLRIKATSGSLTRTANLSLIVTAPPPDFTLYLNPTSLTVQQGNSGTTQLTLTPQNGFTGPVNLTLERQDGTAAPSGITLTPTTLTVNDNNPVTQLLTLSVASSVATGTYSLRVKATSASLTRTADLTLTVSASPPPPDFSISLNPTSLTAPQGGSGGTTLTLIPQNGFTGTVTLTLERQDGTAAPGGITLNPGSVSVTGSGPVTQALTVGVASSVATGTYNLRVKATWGSLTRTADLTLTVTPPPPDFTLALNPTSLTVQQGSSGTTQLTLTPQNGFTGPVNLNLERQDGTPAPSGIALTPTSVTVSGPGSVTQALTLSVGTGVAPGTYSLRVKATSGSLTRTVNLSLTVSPPPSFTLSLNPTSLTVPQGGSGTTQLTLTPQNGFTGTVNLSLLDRNTSSPVDGITLSPTTLTVSGNSSVTQTLTLSVSGSVAPGSYALKVRAEGGSVVREANLNLTVQSPPDLYIAKAEWAQTIIKENLRLVEGKGALLRVYLLGDRTGVSGTLSGAVYQGSTFRGNLSFTCPSPLPTSVDPSSLSYSCNATVSASWVAPGLRVVLTADPDNQVAESNEGNNALTLTPQVGAGTVLYLTVVPVIQQGLEPTIPDFVYSLWRIWPLKEVSYVVRAPYTTSVVLSADGGGWSNLLYELRTLRQTDGSNRYYYGFVRLNYTSGVGGLAFKGYPVAAGADTSGASIMAHELGHNFGLDHAPCGNPPGVDPNYPYPDGSIGVWGYDLTTGRLRDPNQLKDLMSYCGPAWVSDYHYEKAQSFLETNPPQPQSISPQSLSAGEYVLLSGRIEGDSIRLYPPVRYTGYPAEVKPGEYRLEADTEKGPVTLSFAPMEDSEGGLSFQVSLPAAPRSLRIYRGSALLLERQATLSPQAVPEAELKEEGGKVVLTWQGAPYASLAHVAPDGTRTTLGLWHTGGRSEFSTEGLPPGGWFEVQLSDGMGVTVLSFQR